VQWNVIGYNARGEATIKDRLLITVTRLDTTQPKWRDALHKGGSLIVVSRRVAYRHQTIGTFYDASKVLNNFSRLHGHVIHKVARCKRPGKDG
jgi:hypothetical protein